MKRRNIKFIPIVTGAAMVIAMAAAYIAGVSQRDSELEQMQHELDELHASEQEAAIVKRVSKQMEDIAYQQKEQSDRQRVRAEQQTAIANEMRDRAEQESRAAREAEARAVASTREAERERANAISQEQIAIQQRDQATHARNRADTLNCRTLARTLGTVSCNMFKNGDYGLSAKLAYASWYYLDRYGANTYFTDTYLALCNSTGTVIDARLHTNAAVNAVAPLPEGCIAVTAYGGVELVHPDRKPRQLLQNSVYDFRSVSVSGKSIYALSFHGPLCLIPIAGGRPTVFELPHADYFRIMQTDDRTLLLASRSSLTWFDMREHAVGKTVSLSHRLRAIAKRGSKVSLFYDNGTYAEMDGTGKISSQPFPVGKGVSAVCYDDDTQCLYVGMNSGPIHIVNKYNRLVTTLVAHTSRVTDIDVHDHILVSSAYDKAMQTWNLDYLAFDSGLNFVKEITLRNDPPVGMNDAQSLPIEWLSPAVVPTPDNSWALSVCIDGNGYSWTGTGMGSLQARPIAARWLAGELLHQIDNFTEKEWKHYIGIGVPYTTFK